MTNFYHLRLYGLICLLVIAGLLHLVSPDFFYPLFPESFPNKTFFIVITGPLEFLLAYGLYRRSTRKLYSRLTSLWFILLMPFHFSMAINLTPFPGIPSQYLAFFLWGRVALQLLFIIWADTLKPRKKARKKTLSAIKIDGQPVADQDRQPLSPHGFQQTPQGDGK